MMVENGTGLCTAISLYFIHDSTKNKKVLFGWNITIDLY